MPRFPGARNRSRPSSSIGTAEVPQRLDLRAAVLAGIVAGIVSTAAQVALWLAFTDALPGILFRDARLAAAIVMGPDVLASDGDAAVVMVVATIVHFSLSITYGLTLGILVSRLRGRAAPAVGAAFGVALFVLNMFGFTAVFPWFTAARDPITLAAHVVFGASAAGVYRATARR